MFSVNLRQGEQLSHVYRQTKFVLAKPFIICFALIYFPWALISKYGMFGQYNRLIFFWAAIILFYFAYKTAKWAINCYIITNQRLIAIIYASLFSKQVLETPIERILNISFKKKGIYGSVLNFGDVEIQIVGLTEPMIFKKIQHPEIVKDLLWQIHIKNSSKNGLNFSFENIGEIQQKIGYQSKK
jgi:hypothetical protein